MDNLRQILQTDINLKENVLMRFHQIMRRQTITLALVIISTALIAVITGYVINRPTRAEKMIYENIMLERKNLANDRERNRQQLDSIRRQQDSLEVIYYKIYQTLKP